MNLFKKEQKHGRWITTYVPVKFMYNTVTHALKCSECGCVVSWNSKLEKCPNCKAIMDKKLGDK